MPVPPTTTDPASSAPTAVEGDFQPQPPGSLTVMGPLDGGPVVLGAPPRILTFEAVGSTNDLIRDLIERDEAPDGLVIRAERQTGGRGRSGRDWISPAGNLYHSFCVSVPDGPGKAAELSFVAAVALADAISALCPQADPRCKWPNDLLCHGAKVSGILLETAMPPQGSLDPALRVIVGIGINVREAPQASVLQSRIPAGALVDYGCEITADLLFGHSIEAFRNRVETWRARGFAPIREAWLGRALGLGGPVEARLGSGETLSGRFTELDPQGALMLEDAAGTVHRVLAGDVFFGPNSAPPIP
ncbi:MAG: biotin--[acetyl-CoA-carboxylase] ligase [Rhodospirillaceae bacterium]